MYECTAALYRTFQTVLSKKMQGSKTYTNVHNYTVVHKNVLLLYLQ